MNSEYAKYQGFEYDEVTGEIVRREKDGEK
jgi:hypothetical protein